MKENNSRSSGLWSRIASPVTMPAARVANGFHRWVDRISAHADQQIQQPIFQRDPDLIRKSVPLLERILGYFRPEIRGFDRIPRDEPIILIGNHSGGIFMPDAFAFFTEWFKEMGAERPVYGMGHSMVFVLPVAKLMRSFGAIPASWENAERALTGNNAIIIYPGGDHEVFRPIWKRGTIDFDNRQGFVKLALRKGVKIVPFVNHGSHDSTMVIARGDRLAKLMRLERVRVKIFPFAITIPWGIVPGFVPSIPLPAQVTIQICEPLDWSHLGPEAADDPEIVRQCYDEVVGVMQGAMDEMVKEKPFPLFSGWFPGESNSRRHAYSGDYLGEDEAEDEGEEMEEVGAEGEDP